MLDKNFTKNFFKSTLLTSFPELKGDTRKAFFTEYIERVKDQTKPVRRIKIELSLSVKQFSPRPTMDSRRPLWMAFKCLGRK